MTNAQVKGLTDAELRKKYFTKKAKVLKRFGANCGGKKMIIWKMLPSSVATSLSRLKDEFDCRYEWNSTLKCYERKT